MYAVMAVETEIPWPKDELEVFFQGRKIFLRAATENRRADIVVSYLPGEQLEETACAGNAFLSQLAWQTKTAIRCVQYHGTTFFQPGAASGGVGAMHTQHISSNFRLDYMPVLKNREGRLALALFREALGVTSIPYSFLAFYKVIKLLFPRDRKGQQQMAWINSAAPKIFEYRSRNRLDELSRAGEDIGRHIYGNLRCAVAHAYSTPTINPDNSRDLLLIAADLAVVRGLAQYAIEQNFGIESAASYWKEHKYEVSGFRPFLESKGVSKFLKLRDFGAAAPNLVVSLRMRDKLQLEAFDELILYDIVQPNTQTFRLSFRSRDKLVQCLVVLDIGEHRLHFDPYREVQIVDDRSAKAVQYAFERTEMVKDWLSNGETEVMSVTGGLLGRSAPFVPNNINVRGTLDNLKMEEENFRKEHRRRLVKESLAK